MMILHPAQLPLLNAALDLLPSDLLDLATAFLLTLLYHYGRGTSPMSSVVDLSGENLARNASEILDRHFLDQPTHFADTDFSAVDLDLPAEVFELDEAGLKIHQQGGAELVLRSLDFCYLQGPETGVCAEALQLATHDVDH